MNQLTLGVFGTSLKENDQRVAIHPTHLPTIDESLRRRIWMETDYGLRFGVSNQELADQVAGLCSRDELFERCDILLLPKPTDADFGHFRPGQILWGWPHCVQGPAITQVGIDKKMTFIAWEEMQRWDPDGKFVCHAFRANNELAGYCSVLHAFGLAGFTGHYGARRRAVVIGFGSTAHGAVTALQGLGVNDITATTDRPPAGNRTPLPGVMFREMVRENEVDATDMVIRQESGSIPMAEFLAEYDIVVNCILQNTDKPMMFCRTADLAGFKPTSLIIDVSCDSAMGFEWARPTSFTEPAFMVGNQILYYAVDHSPAYMWESASFEISRCVVDFVAAVMAGPDAWMADKSLSKAVEIRDGVVCNPKILRFQDREEAYPHAVRG